MGSEDIAAILGETSYDYDECGISYWIKKASELPADGVVEIKTFIIPDSYVARVLGGRWCACCGKVHPTMKCKEGYTS